MTLADTIAALPPDQREAMSRATYQDLHPDLVEATKTGEFTILDFFDALHGGKGWLQGPGEWWPWRAFLASAFGLPMDARELELYRRCTKRDRPPTQQVSEVWMPIGRRARKSGIAAVIAVFVGAYWDHKEYTAPGQRAVIPVLAKNKGDAQTIKQFVDAILATPTLAFLVEKSDTETVRLTTGVDIQIRAATVMAGRSPAIPLWILDEVAFFRTDTAANPDTEILRGIRPAQATVKHPLGIALSSPYARRGEMWAKYQEHYGKEGSDVLVWQADTLTMHPGNPQVAVHVAKEYEADATSASAEYGANFRTDVETFVPDEIIVAATDAGVKEREPVPGIQYMAFVDPSGGTSDSFTLAIAHWEPPGKTRPGRAVLDLLHEEKAPFDPKLVVNDHAVILRRYGIKDIEGDHYAGEWPSSRYADAKIVEGTRVIPYRVNYWPSEFTKVELYRNVLPLLNSRTVALLDNTRMRTQFTGLDRFVARGGRDSIDHAPGQHDDVANCAAGALVRVDRHRIMPKDPGLPPPKDLWEQLQHDVAEELEREKHPPKTPNQWRRRRK